MKFSQYVDSDWDILVSMIDEFWRDLVAIDPYDRMIHPPEYAEIYSKDLLKKLATYNGALIWAVVEGEKVGFAAGIIETQSTMQKVEVGPSTSGRILELYVKASHRNHGIGAALMKDMEAHLINHGCDTLKVEVFVPNSGAHKLYQRLGYKDWVVDLYKRVMINENN